MLFTAFPLLYVGMGVAMLGGKLDGGKGPPPFLGWMIVAFGVMAALFSITYMALIVYAGRCIKRTQNWTYVIVMAALSCAFFPFGTALGVFTIIILSKPDVRALFQPATTAQAPLPTSPVQG